MLKSYSTAYQSLVAQIKNSNRNINTGPNTVINDTCIIPAAQEIVRETAIADYIQRLQSLDLIISMLGDVNYLSVIAFAYGVGVNDVISDIEDYIDKLGSNYDLIRRGAASADGIVYYARYTPLIAGDSDITISTGSIVSSKASGVKYQVVADVTMYAVSGGTYYDSDLQAYAIPVPVQAVNAGSAGNASNNSIDNMDTATAGMDFITNKAPIANGTDEETDLDFIARIRLVYSGNNVGTLDGYKKLVLENSAVTDCYVAGATDSFMTRDQGYGGKIDIYILENQIAQAVATVTVAAETFVLPNQPVSSIVSISGYGALAVPLFEGNYNQDYEGSLLASARVRWLNFAVNPPTIPYTVTYLYNSNIQTIQNLVNQVKNKIVFGQFDAALVKQAIEAPVDIIFSIAVLSGYSKASVAQQVQTLISTTIDKYKMGVELQQSDMIALAYTIPGLDQVHEPMVKFNRTSLTGVKDTITVSGREYIRAGNVIIS